MSAKPEKTDKIDNIVGMLMEYERMTIDPMMRDPWIEDISCNGFGIPLYIWHRKYESIPTNVIFNTAEELDRFILKLSYMTGRAISIAQPVLDATLPDGSRVQMTYEKEVTRRGST